MNSVMDLILKRSILQRIASGEPLGSITIWVSKSTGLTLKQAADLVIKVYRERAFTEQQTKKTELYNAILESISINID